MKFPALFAAVLLVLSAAGPAASGQPGPQPGDTIRLIDLTDEFDSFWERSKGMGPAERAAALKAEFAPLLPGFYDADRLRAGDPGFYDRHLAAGLSAYPEQRAGIREVSRRFSDLLAPARRSFEAEFGVFPEPQTIYLLHSFGEMDGGTRTLPEGKFLIFGADMIARLHLAHRIQPFFHHELFHLYHGLQFKDCGDALWCSLWWEGLATYVAASLNPGATDAELLLTIPEPSRPAVEANRTEAVCARFDGALRLPGLVQLQPTQ